MKGMTRVESEGSQEEVTWYLGGLYVLRSLSRLNTYEI